MTSAQGTLAQGPLALPKVCIIGAGCSGFTTAKRLKDAGVPYDCFEASDDIGGNWYYKNPNGLSACYESLHIDTSKWRLAFEDFPVPPTGPISRTTARSWPISRTTWRTSACARPSPSTPRCCAPSVARAACGR